MQIVPSTCLVRSELLRWEELFNSADARGLAALHAEDSVLTPPDHLDDPRPKRDSAGHRSEVRNRGGDHVGCKSMKSTSARTSVLLRALHCFNCP